MKYETNYIFPRGDKLPEIYSKYFKGNAYLSMLTSTNNPLEIPIGNVTFEPGCRNNWHRHPGGQILLVTNGCGWYQEEGKKAIELLPGVVVEILPNVKHWHGATKDSWLTHLSIETGGENRGSAEWLEAVTDEEYNKL